MAGSIRKRTTNDGATRWQARWRDERGRTRSKTFDTKTLARRYLAHVQTDMDRGTYRDPDAGKVKVRKIAERWLASKRRIKPKTHDGYRSLLDAHVLPAFGDRAVASIDRVDVNAFVDALAAEGLEPRSVRNVFRVLSAVMKTAVLMKAVAENPCQGVELPKVERPTRHFLTAAQVRTLAEVIDPYYRTMIYFASYTGMRFGEIVALKWKRVDLMRRTVTVSKSVSEVKGGLVTTTPKTDQVRTVRLPAFLTDMLVEHQAAVGYDPDGYVFPGPCGGVLRHGNFYRRHFKKAVADAGLPDELRFHDLRHTCASLLINSGAHPAAVAERLGHKDPSMTLDVYSHLFPSLDATLTDELDSMFQRAQGDDYPEGDVAAFG